MLLRRDDIACFCGIFEHKLFIDRLDGMHIYNRGIYALVFKQSASFERGGNKYPVGDNADIAPVRSDNALAEPEFPFAAFIYLRNGIPAQPHIDRPVVPEYFRGERLGGGGIRRGNDRHPRQRTHYRDIFAELVCRPVLADGNAGV